MTVDKIIPCVCCEHPPSVDDRHEYGMPVLIASNSCIDHLQFWEAKCPKCGRGGIIQYKSAYLALKHWNECMVRCYRMEDKEIVYYEDFKDTCERLGYEYIDHGERYGD
jgi:hypothetical protein